MKEEVLNHLNRIIEAVDVAPDKSIYLRGQPSTAYQEFNIPKDYPISQPIFLQGLQSLLYREFYSKEEGTEAGYVEPVADEEKDFMFLDALRAANCSKEGLDKGWIIEEKAADGSVLLSKGGYKRRELPGEYLRHYAGTESVEKGEAALLYRRKEYVGYGNYFYHIFGHTLLESNPGHWVRLYFNLKSDGAPILVRGLSTLFNHYQVPFSFKCLIAPALYRRTDAGVLYFDKRYFDYVSRIFSTVYRDIQPYLKEGTPLFTRKIMEGIGFAENPFDPQESFGTSRCAAIAVGISRAIDERLSKQQWLAAILKSFEEQYISLETPYLNPNSKYPYSFHLLTYFNENN